MNVFLSISKWHLYHVRLNCFLGASVSLLVGHRGNIYSLQSRHWTLLECALENIAERESEKAKAE